MSDKGFDPRAHLSNIKGQEYLEVKWRLVWLREQYPASVIETTLLSHGNDRAIVHARVEARSEDGEIKGAATGIGSETAAGFGNYIEKAETKAMGRALAALGFGTQFCADFADVGLMPDNAALADSPVGGRPQQTPPQQQQPTPMRRSSSNEPPSGQQWGKMRYEAKQKGIEGDDFDQMIRGVTGKAPDAITKADASRVIDHLMGEQRGQPPRQGSQHGNSEPPPGDLNAVPF